jgi:hypothetical protein
MIGTLAWLVSIVHLVFCGSGISILHTMYMVSIFPEVANW